MQPRKCGRMRERKGESKQVGTRLASEKRLFTTTRMFCVNTLRKGPDQTKPTGRIKLNFHLAIEVEALFVSRIKRISQDHVTVRPRDDSSVRYDLRDHAGGREKGVIGMCKIEKMISKRSLAEY